MLSPRGSQITSKPDAWPDDSVPDDALELGSVTCTGIIGTCNCLEVSGEPRGLSNLAPARSRLFKLMGKVKV